MDRFQKAIHELCAALHLEHVDPSQCEMYLPHDQWWRFACSLERHLPGSFLKFDGRGEEPCSFRYMGILFKVRPINEAKAA